VAARAEKQHSQNAGLNSRAAEQLSTCMNHPARHFERSTVLVPSHVLLSGQHLPAAAHAWPSDLRPL
jgi:hypothetical protein